jgi:hypothetical protein
MRSVPLEKLGLRLRDHGGALWLLAQLYRRPYRFRDSLRHLSPTQQVRAGLRLWLHALPYVLLLTVLSRAVIFRQSTAHWSWTALISDIAFQTADGITFGVAGGIAFGIFFGIVFGIAFGMVDGIATSFGIAFGSAGGMAFGIAFMIAFGYAGGIADGNAIDIAFGIAVGIAFGIALGYADGIAEGIALVIGTDIFFAAAIVPAFGIASGLAVVIAALITYLRLYYLINPVFIWPNAIPGGWYIFHPVAWDDQCRIPFRRLDRLLVAYTERHPERGQREIERLISSYPTQRMAAVRARISLVAREARGLRDLSQLSMVGAKLPEGQRGFLRQTSQVREGIDEIARQQLRLNTLDRPMLREAVALGLVQEIENFRHRLAGFEEPIRTEFRAAAGEWENVAREQLADARGALAREPVRQVFRAGDPVDRESEAFVLRDLVVGQLDQQVTLASGCPGVVLYARRRMGKTTLLRNLAGLLPQSVHVSVISLQDPTAFTSLGHLVARIAQAMPPTPADGEVPTDLPGLQRRLETCNAWLKQKNHRVLLALDEYEQLDVKVGEGVFPHDLLPAIRESIQSHRQITWLFAGSHEITELSHAQWTSHLLSARTIEVPPFALQETRLLLTEPLKHSQLWKTPEARPRFSHEFWGEDGIERIHREADG